MNYDQVPAALEAFCRNTEVRWQQAATAPQQLVQSWVAHFDLVTIHPFYEGNGRTARLVMNLLQHRAQLPLGLVHQKHKAEYYEALETARKLGSHNPFLSFMLAQHRKQFATELHHYNEQRAAKPNAAGTGLSLFFVVW